MKSICLLLFVFLSLTNISCFKENAHIQLEPPHHANVEYQLFLDDGNPETSLQRPGRNVRVLGDSDADPAEPAAEIDFNDQDMKTGICKVISGTVGGLANAIFRRNQRALNKIERHMFMFILADGLADFAKELKRVRDEIQVKLTQVENDAIESALRPHCDMDDLKELYNILVPCVDSYIELNTNSTHWEKFVVTQIDRVNDYVAKHFEMFKRELLRLRNTKDYYERKNFFSKQEGKSVLMTIFYEWLENTVCRPRRLDEYRIRDKLNNHLRWVVELQDE